MPIPKCQQVCTPASKACPRPAPGADVDAVNLDVAALARQLAVVGRVRRRHHRLQLAHVKAVVWVERERGGRGREGGGLSGPCAPSVGAAAHQTNCAMAAPCRSATHCSVQAMLALPHPRRTRPSRPSRPARTPPRCATPRSQTWSACGWGGWVGWQAHWWLGRPHYMLSRPAGAQQQQMLGFGGQADLRHSTVPISPLHSPAQHPPPSCTALPGRRG